MSQAAANVTSSAFGFSTTTKNDQQRALPLQNKASHQKQFKRGIKRFNVKNNLSGSSRERTSEEAASQAPGDDVCSDFRL